MTLGCSLVGLFIDEMREFVGTTGDINRLKEVGKDLMDAFDVIFSWWARDGGEQFRGIYEEFFHFSWSGHDEVGGRRVIGSENN